MSSKKWSVFALVNFGLINIFFLIGIFIGNYYLILMGSFCDLMMIGLLKDTGKDILSEKDLPEIEVDNIVRKYM